MKRTLITSAALAAIVILAANPAISASAPTAFQEPATVQSSYDVGTGGTLRVDASFGSIEVTTSSGNRVDVKVVREVRDRFEDDEEQIISEHQVEMSQSGNDVLITTTVSAAARGRWSEDYSTTPLRVRLEISVPRSYNVDLDTRGGNISVNDLDGEVRTETAGGNLEFGNINGTLWARTAGGNIELAGSSGTAEVRTAGGNIEIGDVDGNVDAETSGGSIHIDRAGGEVRAETGGGNITVDEVSGTIDARSSGGNVSATITGQPAADCRLTTAAGSVTVKLASGIGVDIDASTSIGGVSSDFDVDGRVTRNSISGSINGGGPELHLRTSAGGIRIQER
jgi:DUF4097 and DUF4098 domain-containing protein YvlB